MKKYHKILVALDGSGASENALRQGLKLANSEKSWILCISVMPDYQGELELFGVRDLSSVIKGKGETILEEARQIAKDERGLTVRVVLETGEPYTKISDLAEAEMCDLIVMGRREIGQVTNRVILSSVISRVIGYSKIDVLVVPEKAQIKWKRILFATDGSLGSMRAQSQAINFAKAYGEKVDIVNVVSVTEEFEALAPQVLNELIKKAHQVLEKIQAEFASQGIETRVFVKEGEPANKIIQLAQDENVDAIILGSHGRTGLSRLLMGSVTESVVAVGNCPVMVVHPG